MKIFISQPMRNRSDDEILEERNHIKNYISKLYGAKVEVIDSFFTDFDPAAKPTHFLGESIKLLGEADAVVFAPDWDKNRGCRIENLVAVEYGYNCIYLPE